MIECKKCGRWHIRQDQWVFHELESPGLLAACLKKIPGLEKVKLIDAAWVWTEPHSKRLKVSVDVEHSVMDDKVKLRQKAVVEFVIKNKQCMECIREATDHSWQGLVQLRQHVGHKQSLFLLEHLITQAGLHNLMLNVEIVREGIDFYFREKNKAERVVEFISSRMPTRVKTSKKLVSRDLRSNTSKYEYTSYLEIAPLCKVSLLGSLGKFRTFLNIWLFYYRCLFLETFFISLAII
jgi:nonsense-mediated mRNA decay protein 3